MEVGTEEAVLRLHAEEAVFEQLKPYCMQLLGLLQSPQKPKTAPFLREMACFLRRVPARALQPCLDYTLVPLLLLLDAAVACRSQKDLKSGQSFDFGDAPMTGLQISDNVAEGVLICLEHLFKKCHLTSVNQLVAVLKKITLGALLSPIEASEEFRQGVLRCLRMLLLSLQPCADELCNCKEISKSQYISSESLSSQLITGSDPGTYTRECLLAFLRSQDAAAIVGHWLSLLLQAAEVEVARGLSGSAKLRTEAFLALRVLVARVGTSDALAFFLPGTVSRFAKALHLSKSMISGAAGSADSTDQAVRGLVEFLVTVMKDNSNLLHLKGWHPNKGVTSQAILDALRSVPSNNQAVCLTSMGVSAKSSTTALQNIDHENDIKPLNNGSSLHVSRTTEWIKETAIHVDRMMSGIFPLLCLHPSEKVRKAVVDGVTGLLLECSRTLERCKLMFLECLCLLVCDDLGTVYVPARAALESLFRMQDKIFTQSEVDDMFNRLLDSLPRVVLGNDLTLAVSQTRKLCALMYYGGPELLVSNILCSPGRTSHFMDIMALSLSQNSQFGGTFDKFISPKQYSLGYLNSITELNIATATGSSDFKIMRTIPSSHSKVSLIDDKDIQMVGDAGLRKYGLPQMPPWFFHKDCEKLYVAVASILRLFGFCIQTGTNNEVPLSVIFDTPLDVIRKLISDIRMKEYNKETWKCWYNRSSSGRLLRDASTAVCILNEIIYGTSNESLNLLSRMFQTSHAEPESCEGCNFSIGEELDTTGSKNSIWNVMGKNVNDMVTRFVGSILNEYMASEIWDLPIDHKSYKLLQETDQDLPLHFFNDATMLQQVIISGIGVFSIAIEKNFETSGFMQNCLNLLLQNLVCSNNQIRTASNTVLNVLAASVGYSSVRHLVVENADYIVDYLCRQLRHLDLNPHIPHLLSAMFSYIGASHEILPLLEEPMRVVSLELEVVARHQHPNLTDPFLKAVAEIGKASMFEAPKLSKKGITFARKIKNEVCDLKSSRQISEPPVQASEPSNNVSYTCNENVQLEYWETLQFELNETRKYRRIIGSIAGSCLKAATPLLASRMESTCLVALDIIEAGCHTLSNVEEAYKLEKEAKGSIEEAIQLCSFQELEIEDTADESDENRLLPAVNRIWPHLILCLKNKVSVAAVQRCMHVISSVVRISGGEFFTRRFQNDGSVIWKMLSTSPFQRRPLSSKDETRILLPYRATSLTSEDPISEVSSMKIQEAVLIMIDEISKNKKSAPAMQGVLKKVSGLVVGIACSNTARLRDASMKALSGLSCIDSDLIWLLVADIYYSLKSKDIPEPSSSDLPEIQELLPIPSSSKDYLYVQYGGIGFNFDINPQSVEMVFHKFQLNNSDKYFL